MQRLLANAQAIIFDVDGLLIDSEPLWDKAREEFARSYGKTFSPEVNESVRGRGMKDVMTIMKNDLGIGGELEDLIVKFRSLFYHLALEKKALRLMPGAKKLVEALSMDGKKLGIATSGHTKGKMQEILATYQLVPYFSTIVVGDQVRHGKPAPDIFLLTAKEMNLDKSECVILEDAVSGVMAAKNADIEVIGVQKDPSVAQQLHDAHADVVVSSLTDLL